MRLKDKVAIITGGARGIGKETALVFVREGAKVVLGDFDAAAGEVAVQEIRSLGGEALFFPVNVSDPVQVRAMVDGAVENFGRVDILVNNAGITRDAFLAKMTPEQWEQVIAVNLTGVFNCTRAVAPVMIGQGSGRILNAASVVGLYGNVGQTNYAATKAGVIGMTRSWAKELGRKGITVNAVAPGFIITDMTAKVPEKVLDMMKEKTPLSRLGQPRDVANAYLFLASDEAAYINGVVLSVDGGLVL
ncbi:3-oxoacyl-ACP reductase FabG [Desulfotomaculum copahuensis]|uniref:3-oxoacyl-[acyl-carrier-protein] reductase n=1 Tax=Desulfotomaculum copahuensis TaxID=1838280 RepID=A0A1B7LAZ8_9FIRM|nr:3-oxoacyl-ACP reductase FabG [Desulfotomaculum copahuensis]OAT79493.1 3-oxoacyl-[acyl-carrier-protein] reductase [Desulfotomaculum copahuensis]